MTLEELAMKILALPKGAQIQEAIFWDGKSEGNAACFVNVVESDKVVTYLEHGDGTFTFNTYNSVSDPAYQSDPGEDLLYVGDHYLTKETVE